MFVISRLLNMGRCDLRRAPLIFSLIFRRSKTCLMGLLGKLASCCKVLILRMDHLLRLQSHTLDLKIRFPIRILIRIIHR